MTSLAHLRQLYKKQSLLNLKIDDINIFVRQFREGNSLLEVKNRIDEMPRLKNEFEEVTFEIMAAEDLNATGEIDPASPPSGERPPSEEIKNIRIFQNRWYTILSALQTLVEQHTVVPPLSAPNVRETPQVNPQINVRLPVINLPEFSGAYKEWLPFYDAFNSLIHENMSLDSCQKFHYLKSCLKGEASRAIESLTISNTNYASAWSILQKRYKNERLIVQSHVQAILNTPEILKCSSETLRKLVNDITSNIEALRVLQISIEACDAFIVTIILGKLDYYTRKEFENSLDTQMPKSSELIEFLEKKYAVLESMGQNVKIKPQNPPTSTNFRRPPTFNKLTHVVTSKLSCYYCKQRHLINQCDNFRSMTITERKNEVAKLNLCRNCLRANHITSECKSSGCLICNRRGHHTLLHAEEAPAPSASVASTSKSNALANISPDLGITSQPSANHCSRYTEPNVILSTAVILIKDAFGNYQECRALLDVGSQLNLLSESMSKKLNLKTRKTKISVWGVNQTCSRINEAVNLKIKSVFCPYETTISCYVIENVVVNIPTTSFQKLNIPEHICLADPNFNINGPVDLILGAEIFWAILGNGRIKLSKPNLYLSDTLLGWVVGGALCPTSNLTKRGICSFVQKQRCELNKLIERFWNQEEIVENTDQCVDEELESEIHFVNTHKRDQDGRFIVQLPFKNNIVNLGDSKNTAVRRFLSLERRFRKDSEFKASYVRGFRDLIEGNIIESVPENEYEPDSVFYLPHSGVFKKISDSSKLRIVCDGSSKSSNGLSLNDNLITGPNLQTDLFDILNRFRTHQIVISCDIKSMFLQIKIAQNHINFQRLVWRESESDIIKSYRFVRLVFGLTNSPFSAMRCIRQLALESAEEFPELNIVLRHDIYMDDILCGANNTENAIKLRDGLIRVLGKGCFPLSKWASNAPNILSASTESNSKPVLLDFEGNESSKILGLWWNPQNDRLNFKVEISSRNGDLTKRNILSSIARLYDPIGIISPVTVKAKIIMQTLWSLKIDWDQSVPGEVEVAWKKYIYELEYLNQLHIPRNVVPQNDDQIDLVAFCDASLQAYGAVIYVRCKDIHGKYYVSLLCTKSRVSPIKVVSLPRLELCAAVLAARLMNKVSKALMNCKINKKYYFSDSTIALHYITSNANSWQVFVANRIAKIQNLSNISEWYHVRTKDNPADLISRGAYPRQIIDSKIYWNGPDFLTADVSVWNNVPFVPNLNATELPERRNIVLTARVNQDMPVLSKFSTFTKLQRVLAYCLRFIKNLKNKNLLYSSFLSTNELKTAKEVILKIIQRDEFHDEILALKKNQPLPKNSKIRNLDPFIDSSGIIRVGGRIGEASLPFNQKFQAVLPARNHVTKLLIKLEHISLLHAGPSQTLASLRTKYWPLRAKDEIRRIIHSCVKCFRVSPRLITEKMGNLPRDRLEPCRPFLKIGLDYFGPFYLKQGGNRSKIKVKAWGALFVCLVTRAVHLEVVSNLTSECFINSLRRLIARRGKISVIYCDNATTFVGAKTELKMISDFLSCDQTQSEIQGFLNIENISWKFIPPKAPNFGGLWERLVRSVKYHLKRVTDVNALLTFEEAYTLFTQIEAVINSRPLIPMSNDPLDYQILSPSHFLIGELLTDLPDYDLRDIPDNKLSKWQQIQKTKQHFWKRFKNEVLVQLQQRSKWRCPGTHQPLKVGDLVLIAEDTPPMVWPMGRIEELVPGPDGIIRVASVRTSHGVYKRSVRKLALLPIESEEAISDGEVRD